MVFRNSIPNEGLAIFGQIPNLVHNLSHVPLRCFSLFLAVIDNIGKLVKLFRLKGRNVEHIDISSTVLKLLLRLCQLMSKLFDLLVAKYLLDGLNKSWKVAGETGTVFIKLLYVFDR